METETFRAPTGTSLEMAQLHPKFDNGRKVRIYLANGARVGVLSWRRNPAYTRHEWRNWYLVVQSGLPQFTKAALSLEWVPATARVEFLD